MIVKTKGGVILSVYVQPKASKTEFVGMHGDALKFRVAAPPVEGEANTELCRHLAKLFSLPQRGVSISSGQASRNKRIQLLGVTEDEFRTTFKLPKV
ncbi:MAG: DUF167 domain-containing protein [Nitrospirae bacterium]|nr:DUF167 domain-containing protein [Nitrospirota bacterium]MDA1302818.1 DUF167 domain-containing protein [Nitrospirota bacterium]